MTDVGVVANVNEGIRAAGDGKHGGADGGVAAADIEVA